MASLGAFARSGDPNAPQALGVTWPTWPSKLIFDATPAAKAISVVADYDCYYARRREGSQTTRADRRDDLVEYFGRLEHIRIEAFRSEGDYRPPRRDMSGRSSGRNREFHGHKLAEELAQADADYAAASQWLSGVLGGTTG